MDRKSEDLSLNRAWAWSAWAWNSSGRSRTSWMVIAATMTMTSLSTPSRCASTSMRAMRGSTGMRARSCPIVVSFGRPPSSVSWSAESSCKTINPSRIALGSGGWTKGNFSIAPKRRETICKITLARFVRRISGSVNSGRDSKSSSE